MAYPKKGRYLLCPPLQDRIEIIKNLEMVDGVIDIPNDDKFDDAGGALFKLMSALILLIQKLLLQTAAIE